MKWMDKKIKKMNIWDMQGVKLSCIFFGIFIASYFPTYVSTYKWYFFALFILFALKPAIKLFKK